MKSIVTFSEKSFVIKTPIVMLLILSTCGAITGTVGLFNIGHIYPINHILIGLGIIILSSGLFFLLKTKYYKILVNEEPGYLSLIESTSLDISPLKIPFKYFTDIVIQYFINKENPDYEVMLKNRMGSLMLMSKFNSETAAKNFSKNLQHTMGLNLIINSDIPENLLDRRHPHNPYNVIKPDDSSIIVSETRDFTELTWKRKYHPLQICFIFLFYYGFFHIINFCIVPSSNIGSTFIITIYLLLGLILSVIIMFVLASFIGKFHIIIDKDHFTYYHLIGGRKFTEHNMSRNDIMLIRSSIELSNEEIVIASREGINSLNNLIKKFTIGKKDLKKLESLDEIVSLKNEIITLDVSYLGLAEKLYIEQFILKNI